MQGHANFLTQRPQRPDPGLRSARVPPPEAHSPSPTPRRTARARSKRTTPQSASHKCAMLRKPITAGSGSRSQAPVRHVAVRQLGIRQASRDESCGALVLRACSDAYAQASNQKASFARRLQLTHTHTQTCECNECPVRPLRNALVSQDPAMILARLTRTRSGWITSPIPPLTSRYPSKYNLEAAWHTHREQV